MTTSFLITYAVLLLCSAGEIAAAARLLSSNWDEVGDLICNHEDMIVPQQPGEVIGLHLGLSSKHARPHHHYAGIPAPLRSGAVAGQQLGPQVLPNSGHGPGKPGVHQSVRGVRYKLLPPAWSAAALLVTQREEVLRGADLMDLITALEHVGCEVPQSWTKAVIKEAQDQHQMRSGSGWTAESSEGMRVSGSGRCRSDDQRDDGSGGPCSEEASVAAVDDVGNGAVIKMRKGSNALSTWEAEESTRAGESRLVPDGLRDDITPGLEILLVSGWVMSNRPHGRSSFPSAGRGMRGLKMDDVLSALRRLPGVAVHNAP
jgi:hypothetical protein